MQELLTFVAQSLVEHPDQVSVTETEGPEAIILELHVAEEDMGNLNWTKDIVTGRFYSASMQGAIASVGLGIRCEIYKTNYTPISGYDYPQNDNAICVLSANKYVYVLDKTHYATMTAAEYKSFVTGIKLLYRPATPTPFSFQGAQLDLQKGENECWATMTNSNVQT